MRRRPHRMRRPARSRSKVRCRLPLSAPAVGPPGGGGRWPARAHRDAQPQGIDLAQGRAHRRPRARPSIARRSIPASPNVVLFSPSGAPHPYYAEYGWLAGHGVAQPMPNAGHAVAAGEGWARCTPSSPVTLVWDNGQGLVFRRTISVDDRLPVHRCRGSREQDRRPGNASPLCTDLPPRHAEGGRASTSCTRASSACSELPACRRSSYADVLKDGGSKTFKQTGGWLGFTDKYWAAALVPDQTDPVRGPASRVPRVPRTSSRPTFRRVP